MSDSKTTVGELRQDVRKFVDERDWNQFHNPKNLAMSIAIESAELMEHFQWVEGESAREVPKSPSDIAAIREELADVLCYAISFANALEIDITEALHDKLRKNAEKYPAEKFQGRFR